jgi:tellurite resistance-related uncharacterized protein
MAAPLPYRTTPLFDETTLPQALRREHSTKAGVWGIIRVLEGRLRLDFADGTASQVLTPAQPGFIAPQQLHQVEPLEPMRMQVEFYNRPPNARLSAESRMLQRGIDGAAARI